MPERECKRCSESFLIQKGRECQKYCSVECRDLYYFGKGNRKERKKINNNLGTGKKGALSELLACADLLNQGFEVFRSVSGNCSCDMIVLKKNKMYRVEVKTGYLWKDGTLEHGRVDKKKYDILAVVVDEGIFYTTNKINKFIKKLVTSDF